MNRDDIVIDVFPKILGFFLNFSIEKCVACLQDRQNILVLDVHDIYVD